VSAVYRTRFKRSDHGVRRTGSVVNDLSPLARSGSIGESRCRARPGPHAAAAFTLRASLPQSAASIVDAPFVATACRHRPVLSAVARRECPRNRPPMRCRDFTCGLGVSAWRAGLACRPGGRASRVGLTGSASRVGRACRLQVPALRFGLTCRSRVPVFVPGPDARNATANSSLGKTSRISRKTHVCEDRAAPMRAILARKPPKPGVKSPRSPVLIRHRMIYRAWLTDGVAQPVGLCQHTGWRRRAQPTGRMVGSAGGGRRPCAAPGWPVAAVRHGAVGGPLTRTGKGPAGPGGRPGVAASAQGGRCCGSRKQPNRLGRGR